ncbi:hypothetical protein QUF56_17285 [Ureibacillus composti]|uniref:Uncharacterized protein n=1 Tax=Lysinibacillus composti TaxID=720633 RepID=A0A3N9U9E2_9BACI|nr:hypothetical protein [Lysinibacillus composti]MBM7610152.1 putative membrane protein YkgB [Lysinibacillus composti]MDM5334953.1 hypothetical protein [Ureibacillus composti]RQW73203.1 hypothetical protein EBB45_17725 [Lysinibacillus composti]
MKAASVKSYEQELQSEEPFVKMLYEDLEKRIETFEEELIEKNDKAKISDFIGVTVVMAIITIGLFSF